MPVHWRMLHRAHYLCVGTYRPSRRMFRGVATVWRSISCINPFSGFQTHEGKMDFSGAVTNPHSLQCKEWTEINPGDELSTSPQQQGYTLQSLCREWGQRYPISPLAFPASASPTMNSRKRERERESAASALPVAGDFQSLSGCVVERETSEWRWEY